MLVLCRQVLGRDGGCYFDDLRQRLRVLPPQQVNSRMVVALEVGHGTWRTPLEILIGRSHFFLQHAPPSGSVVDLEAGLVPWHANLSIPLASKHLSHNHQCLNRTCKGAARCLTACVWRSLAIQQSWRGDCT